MTAVTEKFGRTFNSTNPNVARVTTPRSSGGASLVCDNLAGWPDNTQSHVYFSTYKVGTDGKVVANSQTDWKGIVTSNTINTLTRVAGAADTGNEINDYVEMNPTATWADDLVQGIRAEHKATGAHANVTADTLTTTGDVTIGGNLTIAGASSDGGWTPISGSISAVTYNGNRSYTLTTSSDNTANVSLGMRLRTTRTVSAPTQSASLNGTTQYFSKSSPAGMTFTDDFVVSAWVKLSNYPTGNATIISRFNGTSGWKLYVGSDGTVLLIGFNGGSSNLSYVQSYQSLPLNKWVHIAAQLDMSAFTATSTTSYIMMDGVDVPAKVLRSGTNPTALVQAGNLEVGSTNGGTEPFPGKIAQPAVYSAKVTQANIRATISQGLVGNETSLISAYSLSNSVTDLSANANNLTAQGSATTTNADSPFGGQSGGSISSTLDYAIVQKITTSTITVQVSEGCTIPTTGGLSTVSYSNVKTPYGFPADAYKWTISSLFIASLASDSPAQNVWYNPGASITAPVGSWIASLSANVYAYKSGAASSSAFGTLSTANNSEIDPSLTGGVYSVGGSANEISGSFYKERAWLQAAQGSVYLNLKTIVAGGQTYLRLNQTGSSEIAFKNAYL